MTSSSSCRIGQRIRISFKSFEIASGILVQATRLPVARREELNFSGVEKQLLWGLMLLGREKAADFSDGDTVEVEITSPAQSSDFIGEGSPADIRLPVSILGKNGASRVMATVLPTTAAQVIQPILRATVLFHQWPELHFTTGFDAKEVDRAFIDMFGRPDPTIHALARDEL